MGILDDAIREHLELKRQHGAAESELEQLEGEAFGPPERPGSEDAGSDALAEAPTEFMSQPEGSQEPPPEAAAAPASELTDTKEQEPAEQARSRQERAPEIADLQEAPAPKQEKPDAEEAAAAPQQAEEESPSTPLPEPAEEEAPAMEHEAVTELPAPQGPSTEEREAIADPPTELYDVEGEEFGADAQAPSDDELVEEEIGEPRLAPVEPLPSIEEVGVDDEGGEPDFTVSEVGAEEEEEDNFFDEKRLSDELDQALDVPLKTQDEDSEVAEEPESEESPAAPPPQSEEPESEESPAPSSRSEEDVLEETPDFLEEAPEDDQLWFEQKPPKDFDFDD